MEAASRVVKTDYLIVVACDTPLLPEDLAPRLLHPLTAQEKVGHQVVYAHDGFRGQYLFAAMRTQCLHSLTGFLDKGHRAVKHWYETQGAVSVDFSDQSDAFTNFNELD